MENDLKRPLSPSTNGARPLGLLTSPPPLAGKKRTGAPSLPEQTHQRPRLGSPASNSASNPHLEKPRCSGCSFPCWRCHVPNEPIRERSPISSEPSSSPMASSNQNATSTLSRAGSNSRGNRRQRADGLIYLGPKDNDFDILILTRCGVMICPEELFPAQATVSGDLPRPAESRVFLDLGEDKIQRVSNDFYLYHTRIYDETALAFLLADSLILRDHYVRQMGGQALYTLRKDKWRPHKPGPQIPGGTHHYDWDVEPDVTYAVSTNMFSLERRGQLRGPLGVDLLAEAEGICPYLTIEYKSAKGGNPIHARNQVAAASVIWLHQWMTIKMALRDQLKPSDFEDLRHYCVILYSDVFEVWQMSYDGSRYTLQILFHGLPLSRVQGVQEFIKWSNKIHAWGLGPHATAFKKDAEAYLDQQSRPSAGPLHPARVQEDVPGEIDRSMPPPAKPLA